jgi:predicted HicB family RNase H-like nuclease
MLTILNIVGSIEFIEEKEIFYGKLEFINDLITFQGTSVKELKQDFQEAVDEYIRDCAELRKKKGTGESFALFLAVEMYSSFLQKILKNIENLKIYCTIIIWID